MKFETIEIEDMGKEAVVLPATLHYHEDKEVFLKIIDESPDSKEEDIDTLWREVIQITEKNQFMSTKYFQVIEELKSKYIITKNPKP